MITLYELHWSHYCEKVRLALDYMALPWQMVAIDPFKKRELVRHERPHHLPAYTVPAILDDATDRFVIDSTPILTYLADTYSDAPALFPGDPANRAEIQRQLLEFDTKLAIPARRFAYTQVILECPELLPELFLANFRGGPLKSRATGHALGMVLCKRFEFHRSEALGLYEALDAWLLPLARRLDREEFVAGADFSAADLALAAQLRPLTVVPWFRDNPALAGLFARHESVIAKWGREPLLKYQTAISATRTRRAPYRRRARSLKADLLFESTDGFAANDQQHIWTLGMLKMPWQYGVTLRRGKIRQAVASPGVR